MKRKLIGALIVVVLLGTALFQAVPVMADSGELHRVQITPSKVALSSGDTVELTAIAYDSNREEINSDDLDFTWYLLDDCGDIDYDENNCSFTAGDATGVYEETIKVKVVQDEVTKYDYATVTVTGELDHVIITPSTLTVAAGDTKQFKVRSYDDEDVEITAGITYEWKISDDSGSFDGDDEATGQTVDFTAGTETGTFSDAVMVTAIQDFTGIEETNTATVVIKTSSSPTSRTFDVPQLFQRFSICRNIKDFENFLSGEFKIKNGDEIQTIEMIPGVVESYDEDSLELVIIPNEDTDDTNSYTLTEDTVIIPFNTSLAEGDKVVVIIVDDVVTMVTKTGAYFSGQFPPGLNKKNSEIRNDKDIPQGWSRGNKMGWDKNMPWNNNQGKSNDD